MMGSKMEKVGKGKIVEKNGNIIVIEFEDGKREVFELVPSPPGTKQKMRLIPKA